MTPRGVAERLRAIEARIQDACARSGRGREEITLVGAGKRQPIESLQEAWEAGLRVFGENRVQEAEAKIGQLPASAEWHLIGPLQSNKARKAAAMFACVHSVDRAKIARALDREAGRAGRSMTGLLEVNLGREASKHGFAPDELAAAAEPLAELSHLRIAGLMAIPPLESEPEASRKWFRQLRELRDGLFSRPEWAAAPGWLSMGMSGDFEVAIEEGATHVRVGTSLFGPRP